jgi:hypothetical protein
MFTDRRTEFPNLAIVYVLLKSYCNDKDIIPELEELCPTPEDKLCAVRNMACDDGNEEIVYMCDYIERVGLTETFFPK